jgi:MFS superfamily sulfate permease-like transporter
LRFDVVAGLTAAAVVLPKAIAYATVAGLPVAVGLYTAFIPMMIYALLGSSRVLSVSSTATLAILAGTQLGLAVPDGDPAKLVTATAMLSALVGAMLVLARLMKLGFVANFISAPVLTGFKAGIGLVIVLDQVPKLLGIHITKQGFFAQHRKSRSRHFATNVGSGRGDFRGADRNGAAVAPFSGAVSRRWRRNRCVVVLRPTGSGSLDGGPDPAGTPFTHAARSYAH